jgi:hypothetical protein
MNPRAIVGIFCLAGLFCRSQAIEEAYGVNLTADEGFGSRYPGLSNTFLGIRGSETAIGYHPAALNDVDQFWIGIEHASRFQVASYDNFSFVVPFDAVGTMGFGLARYGVSSEQPLDYYGSEFKTINATDYMFVSAFARRWGNLDIGGNLFVLYKQLDQKGMGIRGDFSVQYILYQRIILGALLKGLIPSASRWESEWEEYEPSDLLLGAGYEIPSAYFYGIFRFAVQTKGLLQKHSKARNSFIGRRIYQNPEDIMKTISAGVEYQTDIGLVFRVGIPEVGASIADYQPSFGAGYNYHDLVKLDYSFCPHPELLSTHRISLSVSPPLWSKKFIRPEERRPLGEESSSDSKQSVDESSDLKPSKEKPDEETPENAGKKESQGMPNQNQEEDEEIIEPEEIEILEN